MISNILTRIFGSRNERLLKSYGAQVREICALEPKVAAMSDAELRAKTDEFRKRVAVRCREVAEIRLSENAVLF